MVVGIVGSVHHYHDCIWVASHPQQFTKTVLCFGRGEYAEFFHLVISIIALWRVEQLYVAQDLIYDVQPASKSYRTTDMTCWKSYNPLILPLQER